MSPVYTKLNKHKYYIYFQSEPLVKRQQCRHIVICNQSAQNSLCRVKKQTYIRILFLIHSKFFRLVLRRFGTDKNFFYFC